MSPSDMNAPQHQSTYGVVLAALANGIIPADARDEGAAAVNAGPRLASKMELGTNQVLYAEGIATAREIARTDFQREIVELTPAQIEPLLASLEQRAPQFFKQLRMDVCALYLSEPAVWQRIGFPGPSMPSGHPDFSEPQQL